MSRHRRKERFWLITVFTLLVIFGFLEGWFFRFESHLPPVSNVLLFALINFNVILLLLLVYLVLRNIVKLLYERKRNVLGTRLRTRLVVSFVGLTLIPTLPLFWLATQFMSFSVDYWFSHQMEESLQQAVTLAKDYLEAEKNDLMFDCQMLAGELSHSLNIEGPRDARSEAVTATLLQKYHMNALFFFSPEGTILWKHSRSAKPLLDPDQLHNLGVSTPENPSTVQTLPLNNQREGLIYSVHLPVTTASAESAKGKLVIVRVVPRRITEKLTIISSGYENYLQLKLLHNPLKTSHFITFSIVTFLVIFAAVWFGFFLAKSITVPIQDLVAATQCIADGDLDVQLKWDREDEIGMLVSSFNIMVQDLRQSREQLAGAYRALQQSHVELEERRRYMEIVLRNIAAGVVSVDADGTIMTINKSAEAMLGFKAEDVIGRSYRELIKPAHMEIVDSFFDMYSTGRQPYLEQQVQTVLDNRFMVLLIKVSVFQDESDQYLGTVIVFDDLTDLEKAQRMAAWREVARRIAHEIKNPLTPIQLCAQRLRRRYTDLLEPRGSVMEECTDTIVRQVDLMKHLVNEFSTFARLPRANPVPTDLTSLIGETLLVYEHMHPDVSFSLERDESFPILKLDQVQFKQVMSNLLDNAVHALNGEEAKSVRVILSYDSVLQIARIQCADTGHGLSPEDKLRLFEPYYSTKKKGTGLGLAIVASIVADHNGFVRVRDNAPRGTVIIVELPG